MRFFPSASRQRLAAAAAAGALALGAMSIPSAQFSLAADDLKDQQKKVQKKIHGAAEDLEYSSAAARKALAAPTSADVTRCLVEGIGDSVDLKVFQGRWSLSLPE